MSRKHEGSVADVPQCTPEENATSVCWPACPVCPHSLAPEDAGAQTHFLLSDGACVKNKVLKYKYYGKNLSLQICKST